MLKMLRKNVLVDVGDTTNMLGSVLIELPEKYKRINSRGTIISIGGQCQLIKREDLGEECVVEVIHNGDSRLSPRDSQRMGLKSHWHFIVHEKQIYTVLDRK